MTRCLPALCAVLLGVLGACDDAIEVDDYDRSCSVDGDCCLVEVGEVCSSCSLDAIADTALEDYETDLDRVSCDDLACDLVGSDGVRRVAVCDGGQCVVSSSSSFY